MKPSARFALIGCAMISGRALQPLIDDKGKCCIEVAKQNPVPTLTQLEKVDLILVREEGTLARDVYHALGKYIISVYL